MGHRSIKTIQIYAEVTNMKMDEDMKLLESRIGNKYQFPNADNKINELLEFERNNSGLVKPELEKAI
ncbi:MAG: hypothetical protein LBR46_03075 [Prevotella sp.]|jgi:hypothetical protein|nr:hypothetical protein [Prevotella sp.]